MPNSMYYVNDQNSAFHRRLVSFGVTGWKDHLSRDIICDFNSFLERPEINVPEKKNDFNNIEAVLEGERCEGFYHFTDITNLPNLFESGYLASRSLAVEKGFRKAESYNSVNKKNNHYVSYWLKVQDFARFTFQPNNPIFYNYQGSLDDRFDDIPQPCILRADNNMATIQGVMFSSTNANAKKAIYGDSFNHLENIPIFNIQKMYLDTSSRQAEVLYPIGAPINFIANVNFRSVGELKYASKFINNWPRHINHCINPSLFTSGKSPTYLLDACLATGDPILRGLPDIVNFSLTEPYIGFNFILNNPKDGQSVTLEVSHENTRGTPATLPAQTFNCFNIKPCINQNGVYNLTLTLKKKNNQQRIIYASKFFVA